MSIWDKSVQVEKSLYLWEGEPKIYERQKKLNPNKLQVIELFCGMGGTSLGFEMAGYEIALGVDILSPAIETFRHNHPTATAILGDIRKIDVDTIKKLCPNGIDVIVAGIPCQGFSINNRKRNDLDERNLLYKELLRILAAIKPKAVVVENVSGIKSSANGEVVKEIEKGIFNACGLTVKHNILYAHEYGVPQKRARVVFIGIKNNDGFDFNLIKKTHGPGTKKAFVTIKDAISDLPSLNAGESTTSYKAEAISEYQKTMRKGVKALHNHEAPNHPEDTIRKIASTKPGQPMYPKFKQRIRLSWDIQSPTQVSGGIRPQFQFGHPKDARGLTIRERCRLQSFPDNFIVYGGIVQGRVQTGNAVPPLLAKAIANALNPFIKDKK